MSRFAKLWRLCKPGKPNEFYCIKFVTSSVKLALFSRGTKDLAVSGYNFNQCYGICSSANANRFCFFSVSVNDTTLNKEGQLSW